MGMRRSDGATPGRTPAPMARLSPLRRLLKRLHPEGIPGPAAWLYNRLSGSDIFLAHYDLLAEDIVRHGRQGRLLDIGTGPGRLLVALHRLAPELALTGLDVSPAMVEQARHNLAAAGLAAQVEVVTGDAAALPFADRSFDLVVSTGSIHHWKQPAAALNDIHRVLRAGGWALLYDIVSDTPAEVLRETRRRFGRLRTTLFWLHSFEEPFYDEREFAALAGATAFGGGETSYVGVLCCLALRK